MDNRYFTGQRRSFYSLFKNNEYTIKIPRMQRDYAQGRESSKTVRDTFLKALYTYLEEDIPAKQEDSFNDLDFIYGVEDKKKEKIFIPLDGQQRLTTLFLLHWYLARISNKSEEYEKVMTTETGRSRFIYETRVSSSEFCDALLTSVPPYDAEKRPSKQIRDCMWFRLNWDHDPTVTSMLTMLDAIHDLFKDKGDYYERLTREKNPAITFFMLPLQDSQQTDELYIKMNARGKRLTDFEIFKAALEKRMEAEDWRDRTRKKRYTLAVGEATKECDPAEYFSIKIDTDWSDLFWPYRDKQKTNTFDAEIMNFIRLMFAFSYLSDYEKNEDEKSDDTRKILFDAGETLSLHDFEERNALKWESVELLIDAFDALHKIHKPEFTGISSEYAFYYDEKEGFKKILENPTYEQRVLFYAYIQFLIHGKGDNNTGLNEWMRVMRNLVKNTGIDNANVERAIRSINTLLPERLNILKALSQKTPEEIGFFSKAQSLEEIIKSVLILMDPLGEAWKKEILKAEANEYFEGQTGFLLDFCGLIQAHKEGKLKETANDEVTLKKFADYTRKVNAVFPRPGSDTQFAWERAVLSKGDYTLKQTAERRNFLSASSSEWYNWKRFFRLREEDDAYLAERRPYAQAVFDDPRFDADKPEDSLAALCETKTGDWRDYIIKNPALIAYCTKGIFSPLYDGENNEKQLRIYLYSKERRSGAHVEMLSYELFEREIREKCFEPFKHVVYYDGKEPCAWLRGDAVDQNITLEIYGGFHADKTTAQFKFIFYSENGSGTKRAEKYPDELRKTLEDDLHYEWQENEHHFQRSGLAWGDAVKALSELCAGLKKYQA